ncbi:bifunctional aspartate kinase/homoserine dehydrogenase I [Wenzhouxiangella sp. XN79A]|uniref:bifunctional aspartate kinase/homoserine dehydrogenase I n=1 Tax=Wenzhouxiangella sp. XN79A TaxID=2724193 RepID=UPI00144AAEB5|nr:bifunctional aspartate kinase/homoserine dehydrogenase I [Wenzhouxiangella sp. XN79A]NKI33689.1 bifunctional aspartate kinase/homoserine dehydrogenase I [Wenzhouxiangella sp. XN79A]
MSWIVHKFGGSSLADADAFEHVGRLLLERAADGRSQAVVVSAMQGTTDALIDMARAAGRDAGHWRDGLGVLRQRHRDCAVALALPEQTWAAIELSFRRLEHLLESFGLLGSVPDEAMDLVSALGEQWSARLLSGWFEAVAQPGRFVDAREVIRIRRGELGPIACIEDSRLRLETLFDGRSPARFVITGFCCRDEQGRVATLGRDGSDFTATIVAALLEADEVEIWTDVDGVLNADPGRVPRAEVVERLSYREAFELAYFGARVLHPQTLSPLLERDVPVRIRSTRHPDRPGTGIDRAGVAQPPVKGLTCIRELALVNVEGAGMLGVPGTAERVFATLHRAGISVTMISQGSSEHSICCVVPAKEAERAERVLGDAFAREIDAGQLQSIRRQDGIEVLAAVGDGMAGAPGVAGRMFTALGRAGVNIRAIAQGSSERNISVAVDAAQAERAMRAVHSAFYLSEQTLSIGVIGPGQVGRALLAQLRDAAPRLAAASGIDLRIRAVANSSRMVLAEERIDHASLDGDLAGGLALDFDRLAGHVHAERLPHAVLIDCTASAVPPGHYAEWLDAGIHVITPNKQAGAGDLARYRALRALDARGPARWRYEATVGAGLPVIQTLRDLIDSGDRVDMIEGIFSGTLAWLFNRFEPGTAFSALVREAHAAGYTEPDPADDLSGLDVARKLVILGRELGLDLAIDDVEIEPLLPDADLRGADAVFEALPSLDAGMAARRERAAEQGACLRYTARLTADGTARVGLEELPGDHPFAHLALTDNVVAFRTARYCDNPLIVQGPGAGPAVTAAGVFSDLLRIAQSLG